LTIRFPHFFVKSGDGVNGKNKKYPTNEYINKMPDFN